jgi:hypothetical protein|tara:strand:+ start:33 stop:512 length:480 start_codon:yes stop_codon:yes gene_type:complete
MKKAILIIVLGLLLHGCANESGARMGLFTAKSPVAVTIKGDIFVGWAVGDITGSGTIDIQSAIDPENTCIGEFRYTSTWSLVGKGTVSCKDGSQGQFNFKGLTNLKGYGYGTSNRGAVTFTYGMTAKEAAEYLQKPFPELDKIIEERKKRDKEKKDQSA